MYGDESKYEKSLRQQQDKQKQRYIDEQAGQQRLPIDMPEFKDSMSDDEKSLASKLIICTILMMMQASARPSDTDDQVHARMTATADKYERELILQHRAIVAKAVNDASQRLPSAGSF